MARLVHRRTGSVAVIPDDDPSVDLLTRNGYVQEGATTRKASAAKKPAAKKTAAKKSA